MKMCRGRWGMTSFIDPMSIPMWFVVSELFYTVAPNQVTKQMSDLTISFHYHIIFICKALSNRNV